MGVGVGVTRFVFLSVANDLLIARLILWKTPDDLGKRRNAQMHSGDRSAMQMSKEMTQMTMWQRNALRPGKPQRKREKAFRTRKFRGNIHAVGFYE